jgi:hypothetical protein
MPLKIIEFTDNTYAKPKLVEEGWYTVTIGAALTNMTIARTTPQITSDANANAYDDTTPTAISIGTAANVLIFMGPGANDALSVPPYFETSLGDNIGFATNLGKTSVGSVCNLATDLTGKDWYWEILLLRPLLVKRLTVRVTTAYTGASPVSTAYARIYAVNSSGRPGKLLLDLGALGGANPLNATGNISTAVHSTGLWLPPGVYFGDLFATFTGGSAGPVLQAQSSNLTTGTMGMNAGVPISMLIATGGSSTASDPANVTGLAISAITSTACPFYGLHNA